MGNKEKVDKYLSENFDKIQKLKDFSPNNFRWQLVADSITEGLDKDYVRHRFNKLRKTVTITPTIHTTSTIFNKFQYSSGKEDKTTGKKEWTFTADYIPTEEEIVNHFNIDITKWKIINIYHKTSFGGKYSVTIQTNLIKSEQTSVDFKKEFQDFIDNRNVKILLPTKPFKVSPNRDVVKETLAMITLSDLHLGKKQDGNYIEKITNRCKEIITACFSQGISNLLILSTGDLIHMDNSRGTTTALTQLEFDDTYENSFTKALNLVTELIDEATKYIPNVTFVNVRGNHDFDTSFVLGQSLKKIYEKQPQVTIINSETARTYYYWNNNAFLFAHGDKGVDRLPLTFATEGNKYFSKAKYRHILLGHLHYSKSKQFTDTMGEFNGIEVRVLSSPSKSDRWHTDNAFVENNKNLISFIFTPDEGKYAEYNFKL